MSIVKETVVLYVEDSQSDSWSQMCRLKLGDGQSCVFCCDEEDADESHAVLQFSVCAVVCGCVCVFASSSFLPFVYRQLRWI